MSLCLRSQPSFEAVLARSFETWDRICKLAGRPQTFVAQER
jgi:hypothetical protein